MQTLFTCTKVIAFVQVNSFYKKGMILCFLRNLDNNSKIK
jgi:hypothetical protein